MTVIIAIGGGQLREGETLMLDKQVMAGTGKTNPNALIIPTASSDSPTYYEVFHQIYGKKLGCQTDVLYLLGKQPTLEQIQAKIAWADLVYVGGGNTLKMMKRWRKLGVDTLLKRAHQNGTVMSGISAGAICWFAYGHSDSRSFAGKADWPYIRVTGLGLVNAIFCPHLDGENRTDAFKQMLQKYPQQIGIACEDNCAIEIVDDTYRIIGTGNAYRFLHRTGHISQHLIEKSENYADMADLLSRR